MIRSHHITAELAREHQWDLLVAARGARGDRPANEAIEVVAATPSVHHGAFLRHWLGRDGQRRAASGRRVGESRPAGRPA